MRVLVIPIDVPLPARSGGRIDVWRRLQALNAAGATLGLLCWFDARDGRPDADTMSQLHAVVSSSHMMPVTRSLSEVVRRLLNLWRWPSHVASRWVTTPKQETLAWAKAFAPDVILLDGLYGAAVARWLSKELRVPLVYRSHNIEHLYMKRLHGIERSWKRRLGLLANLVGLERIEKAVVRQARTSLDISLDDLAWWQRAGMVHAQWLPTSVDDDYAARLAAPVDKDLDILYFGNLHTPNNVDAVRWLLEDVAPRLKDSTVRLALAGSKPSAEVLALLQARPNVTLIDSPVDMAAVIRRAKVLVNPVRFGSGVNLKSVEMLFSTSSLVSSTVGVQGLPDDVKQCFVVTDDAATFASAIDDALASPPPELETRQKAQTPFTGHRAWDLLEQVTREEASSVSRQGSRSIHV